MKKLYFLALFAIGIFAQAQMTFNPGFKAGANFSHLTNSPYTDYWNYYEDQIYYYGETDYNIKSRVDFYVGFQANLRFGKYYALQPEIYYTRQGAKLEPVSNDGTSKDVILSYIGGAAVNKLYMNKFNIHLGPTLEFLTESTNLEYTESIDLGVLLGVGYDFTPNFGAEARIKKGFVPVHDGTNMTFQTGVYYTFKLK